MAVPSLRSTLRVAAGTGIGLMLAAGTGAAQTVNAARPAYPAAVASTARRSGLPGWLEFGGELRGRGERLTGMGFVPGNDDSYYLHRLRLTAALKPLPSLRAVVQFQDSQVLGFASRPISSMIADTVDLRQAFVEAGKEGGRWTARIGRQHMNFGENRLIATSNWGNVGPAFDAVRVSYADNRKRMDWFASALVVPANGRFNRPCSTTKLHGFYGSFLNLGKRALVEPYLFWKSSSRVRGERGQFGALDLVTSGVRSVGSLPARFDWNVEMAFQTGGMAGDDIQAWAGHWEVGRKLWNHDRAMRGSFEFNYSTGDKLSGDGKRQSFDQHYPANKFGTADTIAWRNLRELAGKAEWKPHGKWTLRAAYQHMWLATRQDALYSFLGPALAFNPNADSSRVGQQFDFRVIGQLSPQFQLYSGFARFFPGPFMKQASKGSPVSFPYVMWTYAF